MDLVAITIGLCLGVLGGAAHLGLTFWRARQVTAGYPARAWLALPIGLAAVGLALYGAAQVAPSAAWAFVVGLFVTRLVVLHRTREAPT